MDSETFKLEYPFASQALCRAAIEEQGLAGTHYAYGGRKDGKDRFRIAEWENHKHGRAPVAKRAERDDSAPRKPGAISTCMDIMFGTPALKDDKGAFVAACVAAGVSVGTASTQWYRLRK